MKILLTVPHAYCDELLIYGHYCDPIAEEMAKKISRKIPVDLEIGDIPRPVCDLNRIACRITDFRRRISRKIKNFDLILDIHSYPSDSEYGPWDITILEDRQPNLNLTSYSLYKYLQSFGINVGLIYGKDNDIIDEANEKGVDAFLIEFNESLSEKYNNYLVSLIVNWISTQSLT